MRNEVRIAAAFLLAVSAPAAWPAAITQTVVFPTIQPFGTFSTGNVVTSDWSGNPFPLSAVAEINSISFSFATDDPDFVAGGGPTGGNPGVEIGVLDGAMARIGLASVAPATLSFILTPDLLDPQQRFAKLAPLLLDGAITLSLGAFENLGTSSADMTLDERSRLTITLDYTPRADMPLPGTALLVAMGLGLLAWQQRRT